MARLFFLISGEYESLSFSELKAILETEGFTFSVTEELDQTARIDADVASIAQIQRRSAYTRVCALELFISEATEEAITQAAEATNFCAVIAEGETFAVRIRRIKEYSTKDSTMRLERKLGRHILQNTKGTKVNLKKPTKTFLVSSQAINLSLACAWRKSNLNPLSNADHAKNPSSTHRL